MARELQIYSLYYDLSRTAGQVAAMSGRVARYRPDRYRLRLGVQATSEVAWSTTEMAAVTDGTLLTSEPFASGIYHGELLLHWADDAVLAHQEIWLFSNAGAIDWQLFEIYFKPARGA